MSSIGSVTYGVAKELARILKPLVDKTIYHVIKGKLEQDTELPNRNRAAGALSKQQILPVSKLTFEHTKGTATGSPVSPIMANIYMEAFEHRTINTVLNPSKDLEEVC